MKPIKLTLSGIGPHLETEIDFTRFRGGVVAVHGPTGTGKTTAVSAIVSAIWGKAPLKGDLLAGIKETLSIGRSTPATIELEVESNGVSFRITREISAAKHTATVIDSLGMALAGPKVGDAERTLEQIGCG